MGQLPVVQISLRKKLQKALAKLSTNLILVCHISVIFWAEKALRLPPPPPPFFGKGRGASVFAATGCRDLCSPSATPAAHAAAWLAAPMLLPFQPAVAQRSAVKRGAGEPRLLPPPTFLLEKKTRCGRGFHKLRGHNFPPFWNTIHHTPFTWDPGSVHTMPLCPDPDPFT